MYVSAVSVQVLVLSRLTATVPVCVETTAPSAFSISPLMQPVSEDPFTRVSVSDDDLGNVDSQSLFAAKELRFYLGRITAAVFTCTAR